MQGNGLVQVASPHTVDETVRRLESVLAERGVRVFVLVDHSGEAEKVGMKMRPTKLIIFGNPKGFLTATALRCVRATCAASIGAGWTCLAHSVVSSAADGGESSLVGRSDFKSEWGSETVSGGFDSHSLPPDPSRGGSL